MLRENSVLSNRTLIQRRSTMKKVNSFSIWLILTAAFLLTGCYTQFEVVERTVYIPVDSNASSQSLSDRVEQRSTQSGEERQVIEHEEDYTLGYEDGWEDAESYYFKDYESAQWYKEKGITLSGQTVVHNHYYADPFYTSWNSPWYNSWYGFYGPGSYWGGGFWAGNYWGGYAGWGWRWGWGYPSFAYAPWGGYTVYPWGGWGYPSYGFGGYYYGGYYGGFYGGYVVDNEVRDRTARSTGFRSGSVLSGRTRVVGGEQTSVQGSTRTLRSDLRANVRSSIRGNTSRTTSRSGNTVRSGTSTRSSSINRVRSSNSTGRSSSGTVRSGSSTRSSSGSRVRSNSSSSGSRVRSSSSSGRTSSGTVRSGSSTRSSNSRDRDQERSMSFLPGSSTNIDAALRNRVTTSNRVSSNRTSSFRQFTRVLGEIFDVSSVPVSGIRSGQASRAATTILDAVRTRSYSGTSASSAGRSTSSSSVSRQSPTVNNRSSSVSSNTSRTVSRSGSSSGSRSRSTSRDNRQ